MILFLGGFGLKTLILVFILFFSKETTMTTLSSMRERIVDYMSYLRPFLEDHNTIVKLQVLLKYRLGNKLISHEEIDVGILI